MQAGGEPRGGAVAPVTTATLAVVLPLRVLVPARVPMCLNLRLGNVETLQNYPRQQ